ncbi:metallophosphoesterase [Thalassiella azotivora]
MPPVSSTRRRALTRVTAGCALAGAGALAWAAGYEVRSFRLRRVTAPVLAPGAAPLRVLHLSDLHMTPHQESKVAWVAGLAALEPDLVVDTGDNLAHLHAVPAVVRTLRPLLDLPGAFVLGSNDYFGPLAKNPLGYLGGPSRVRATAPRLPTEELTGALTAAGWADLTNARATLTVDGRRVDLVGVDDPHLRRDRYLDVAGPADPAADLTLGVTHAPYLRVLDAMTADRADLVLAGHTHGGQVAVPGVGALVTNCDLPRRYAKGLHRWHVPDRRGERTARRGSGAGPDGTSTWLHVSAGLGTSPYAPIRFACPPEATLLTLVGRDAATTS